VSVAVRKLEGVESIEVSLEKASAVITFNADNKITLPQLRKTIRSNGYPTRDAQVVARGRIVDRDGKPALDLLNGSLLELTEKPKGATSESGEVTGVSRLVKDTERLTIGTMK
jgi:copper chaperone CopZ